MHRFLAQAPPVLLGVQLEDLMGEHEQPNLPSTTDEHPNWRRRIDIDALAYSEEAAAICDAVARARRRGQA